LSASRGLSVPAAFRKNLPRVNIAGLAAEYVLAVNFQEEMMAVASVTKITAASSEGFDAAVREGLARANRTLRGITGLHVVEHKASVENGKVEEYRVTMEVTFILEN
jgi:flavin-binding protein dodecin